MPVLAYYWLKTVYASGHPRAWWRELNRLVKQVLREQPLDDPSRTAVTGIQSWIQQSGLLTGKAPLPPHPRLEPFRAKLSIQQLAPYIGRLLNQWLSAEVASMLVDEGDPAREDGGIPVLTFGKALERLLVRERLSPETLEMLLQLESLSPRYIYAADAELLRDVVACLLGRTGVSPAPVMPATLLGVAAGPLTPDYAEAVQHATWVHDQDREEIRVPVGAAQAADILKSDPVRLASVIVTMDGRWWESESLQSGEQHAIVYKPGGRLRIEYSMDHTTLDVSWPDTPLGSTGYVHLPGPFQVFGREWQVASCETDGEHTWLHSVFSRALSMAEPSGLADAGLRRSHSASVDMAWAALEDALATAVSRKSREPIEQLRRASFIPLGRAIFELTESAKSRWWLKQETIEAHLKAIRYFQSGIGLEYGRVPWRILPAPLRTALLKRRLEPALIEILNEVFDALPDTLRESASQPTASISGSAHSPSQAA